MAVLMRNELPGMTAEQFNAVFAPLLERIKAYPGFIVNANGPTADGYQVTEIWESEEAHERWLREVIAPTARGMGIENIPPSRYETLNQYVIR